MILVEFYVNFLPFFATRIRFMKWIRSWSGSGFAEMKRIRICSHAFSELSPKFWVLGFKIFVHVLLGCISRILFAFFSSSVRWRELKNQPLLYYSCILSDNNLYYLEAIHNFVEVLNEYFHNVCELDLVFNFYKAGYKAIYILWSSFRVSGENN